MYIQIDEDPGEKRFFPTSVEEMVEIEIDGPEMVVKIEVTLMQR